MRGAQSIGVVIACLLLCTCASSGTEPWTLDTSTDTGSDLTDLGWDPATDTGWDPATDTGTEYGYDPGTDTGYDPGTDTGYDTGTDTGYDPGTDTGYDPGYDPGTDPGSGGVVGDACSSITMCTGVPGSGRTCLTSIYGYVTFPSGYCSAICTSSMDCGTGGTCVDFMGYGNYCLKPCTSPYDCRTSEGYSCNSLPSGTGGTYCLPPISTTD